MKRRFWFMAMLVSTLICIVTVCAAAPTLTSISRPYAWDSTKGIYYLQGSPLQIKAIYTGTAPASASVYWASSLKGSLTIGSSNTITGTFTPTSNDYYPGVYSGSKLYSSPKNIEVRATNSDGTTTLSRAGYVTIATLAQYQSVDTDFYYYDETTNNFEGLATPAYNSGLTTYNCLAYSIDVYDSWQWPWSGTPTHTQLVTFMLGADNGTGTGTPRTYGTTYSSYSTSWVANETKVIYYNGNHFAKVISYNSNGSPKRIISKWGEAELIMSESYDPFTSSTYGSATYFFQ